jgi:hypothetical protein
MHGWEYVAMPRLVEPRFCNGTFVDWNQEVKYTPDVKKGDLDSFDLNFKIWRNMPYGIAGGEE